MPPDPARRYPAVSHCEESKDPVPWGRRANLLPLTLKEPFIFLRAPESQLRLVESFFHRRYQIGTRGYAND
jgi:hypothetical protein